MGFRSLELLVVGDYALATGEDSHVKQVARRIAPLGAAIASVVMVPADRIALAAAIDRAWTSPSRVLCFGGLGEGSDDHVRVTVAALQSGRVAVGLPRLPETRGAGFAECGNIAFFSGNPERAHLALDAWLAAVATPVDAVEGAHEFIDWTLPESPNATAARAAVKRDHPAVMQRVVVGAAEARLRLRLTGASRGQTQVARKALQRRLAAVSREREP